MTVKLIFNAHHSWTHIPAARLGASCFLRGIFYLCGGGISVGLFFLSFFLSFIEYTPRRIREDPPLLRKDSRLRVVDCTTSRSPVERETKNHHYRTAASGECQRGGKKKQQKSKVGRGEQKLFLVRSRKE